MDIPLDVWRELWPDTFLQKTFFVNQDKRWGGNIMLYQCDHVRYLQHNIELCITSDLNNKFEVFLMDNEFDLGDGWLSLSIAFFSDSILEYLIKSASSSFIQANTFIKLFFKYIHWLDTFKTSWPQLLR